MSSSETFSQYGTVYSLSYPDRGRLSSEPWVASMQVAVCDSWVMWGDVLEINALQYPPLIVSSLGCGKWPQKDKREKWKRAKLGKIQALGSCSFYTFVVKSHTYNYYCIWGWESPQSNFKIESPSSRGVPVSRVQHLTYNLWVYQSAQTCNLQNSHSFISQ